MPEFIEKVSNACEAFSGTITAYNLPLESDFDIISEEGNTIYSHISGKKLSGSHRGRYSNLFCRFSLLSCVVQYYRKSYIEGKTWHEKPKKR